MSFKALAWAVDMQPGRSSDKLILIGLADRHNTEEDVAWPSIKWLGDFSGLDRKTIISALDRLQEAGLIADSGIRYGQTAQVKAYRLSLDVVGKTERFQKRNGSENGAKQSQKRDTEPVRNHLSQANACSRAHAMPDGFVPELTGKAKATVAGWPQGKLETETERFTDYHMARGTLFKDWQAAFRTWVGNVKGFGGNDNGTGTRNQELRTPMARALAGRQSRQGVDVL